MADQSNALAGRIFNWTFNDGPTAGKTYQHKFGTDGTVTFSEAGSAPAAADPGPGNKYAAFQIAPSTYLVSYLSSHGFTLTVAMNLDSRKLHGFASGNNEWHPIQGTLEVLK